jgi:H+/Cl- antiporter ClcA
MNWFKQRWDIQKKWQLLYPLFGFIGLLYSSYKLSLLFIKESLFYSVLLTAIICTVLLYFTLWLFKKLENRWKFAYRWQMIRIFIVFAITGSLSLVLTKPIFGFIGFIKENFNSNGLYLTLYYILKIVLVLPFYNVLLVFFGWVFNEFDFFYTFTKKMAKRFRINLK